MIGLRAATAAQRADLLRRAAEMPFSYAEIGQIDGPAPPGYWPLEHTGEVGHGPAAFVAAAAAIDAWGMMPAWVQAEGSTAVGGVAVVASRQLGLHTLNACRVVARIEETTRRGFTYGTLTAHVERGEERFLAELHPDGRVTFAIKSFSRPAHPLVWLGLPLARHFQHRFARDAIAALRARIAAST